MRMPKSMPPIRRSRASSALVSLSVIGVTLAMAGCQATPTDLPQAQPAVSTSCEWSPAPGSVAMTDVVAALERRDFLVRDTDAALGVVSAERVERATYHNADAVRPQLGGFVLGGSGGRVGGGVGVGVGFGGGGWGGWGTIDDATRVERVSVALDAERIRVTRDIRLFDWRGDLRESRTASDSEFCVALRNDLLAAGPESTEETR
ncbi:hypothetical protein ACUN9Y_15785 [Halomonas sp. V046]|uniref:hypothetical protein n=1 Tax=Halomonas sp. V046 TaxID=3459611 RepID=UPI0040440975